MNSFKFKTVKIVNGCKPSKQFQNVMHLKKTDKAKKYITIINKGKCATTNIYFI